MTKYEWWPIAVECLWWYDWIAYYYDWEKRLSVVAKKIIDDDELCKCWKIYKVKVEDDYKFTIISSREDK